MDTLRDLLCCIVGASCRSPLIRWRISKEDFSVSSKNLQMCCYEKHEISCRSQISALRMKISSSLAGATSHEDTMTRRRREFPTVAIEASILNNLRAIVPSWLTRRAVSTTYHKHTVTTLPSKTLSHQST